jgi:hypothetical protein
MKNQGQLYHQQRRGNHPSQNKNTPAAVPQPGPRILLLIAILAAFAFLAACGGLKGLRVEDTPTVQIDLTQSMDDVQGTLSALATQTAQALPPTETPIPPTPTTPPATPTFTNTPTPEATKPPPQEPGTIEKIRFRSGGTSAYTTKSIEAGDLHRYRVRAIQGQTMILTASSPDNDVYLDVKGYQGGQILLTSESQASYWLGTLPSNQEYLISLTTDNPDTYYFLTIEIPANIYFDKGAYSDTIDGYINVDETFHPDVMTRVRYMAYAFSGQTMTVELSSPNLNDLSMGISGKKTGEVYVHHQVLNSGGEFVLPATQHYYLDIYSISGTSTSFTLKLTIK